ncbi:AAA family ATPase [Nocardia grenadensis]|uniref:ATP-dependent nuclease n=1 Tax=Nocardia grenadensis TaxID=931537 RepID=UPI003D8FAB48
MKITVLRLSNFQSFGALPTAIALDDLTYVLGPNGAGKTAVLGALSRLFSPVEAQRRIRLDDFHVPLGRSATEVQSEQAKLWLEVDIEVPEAAASKVVHASVPANFLHMAIATLEGVPRVRVRLSAELAADGVIDEKIEYVHEVDVNGEPLRRSEMSRYDRRHIEVHYLPARRNPADHIAYTTTSLVGRVLRAADWTIERATLEKLANEITLSLAANGTVAAAGTKLSEQWHGLHHGTYFTEPSIAFGQGEFEDALRALTVHFSPSPSGTPLPFERLSDGQKSLLYISLVLAWQSLSREVLTGSITSLDIDRLRPPVHTVIALEEPENSLAPHYLGRIISRLRQPCDEGDVQALIATHAPSLLRRVDPSTIRFLRLNNDRETAVHRIVLPDDSDVAAKYVREAVQAYPELYFARFVVLGEGASEQVVLPRVLAAAGLAEDDASVAVVPLGGRHVNHFWRLLTALQIPHATLLDLDAGRYQGGWGRISNAMRQINAVRSGTFEDADIAALPKWDADKPFPVHAPNAGPVDELEQHGVFFSAPVDLDLMMLESYPTAYKTTMMPPTPAMIVSVLGKSHANHDQLPTDIQNLFDNYHSSFGLGSKPAAHLAALSELSDRDLRAGLPGVLERLVDYVRNQIDRLPE